jgi:transcriptional regulator with XRE-family HTH domain
MSSVARQGLLRLLRAKRGLSQEALAFECGINRTYLSGVERSERNVSIDNIEPWRLLKND